MPSLGPAQIIRGNALDLPIADDSVDLCVTSPPYFGLRSYTDNGEHYGGQIGSEATPAEFVDALIAATREMVRVTKPSGSIFVNLGDKYATGSTPGPQSANTTMTGGKHKGVSNVTARKLTEGVRAKSLIGIPWRYALRCINDLGLILRAEMIWSKPNGLPESVTDRVRRSHETWFHFTLQPRYYSAIDEIREEQATVVTATGAVRYRKPGEPTNSSRVKSKTDNNHYTGTGLTADIKSPPNPLGKLPGSVWSIPTQPLKVPAELGIDHFAAFPMEWPRRIISGWSPAEVCSACGEGRRPVTTVTPVASKPFAVQQHERSPLSGGTRTQGLGYAAADRDRTITGYACACPDNTAPSTPGVVLDPFGGTGTTALMARALGRTGISVDMSADYCRLAAWRTNDPGQLAAALQVEKPEAVHPDQLDLFEESA